MVDASSGYELNDDSLKVRADALEKPAETKPEVKAEEKPVEKVDETKPEVKVDETKPVVKDEKHIPNDPSEFQKFVTRSSQENAELRRQNEAHAKEIAELRELVEKATKKPINWDEIAKDPKKAQELWEEHEAEVRQSYEEKIVVKEVEHISKDMARDSQTYPDYKYLYPLMVRLTENEGAEALKHDPNFNFNRDQKVVLHDLYKLAEKISPKQEQPKGDAKSYTAEEIEKIREDARQEAAKAATEKEVKQNAGQSATGQFGGKGRKTPTSLADEVRNAPSLDEARKALKRSQGK